jgi:SecD/SecF fusion protein
MRSFFWKFLICLAPCVLAAWVTVDAILKYQRGESGGFKLGVDLVGGTVLVYEIDPRKPTKDVEGKTKEERDKAKAAAAKDPGYDPTRDLTVLAEALKRRIDPNDLKNITIRPSGGEGRVEIVLPTGGTHRAKIAEEKWRDLIQEVCNEFGVQYIQVGRGRVLELAERIQLMQSHKIWQAKLFNDQEAWDRLFKNALDYWPTLDTDEELHKKVDAARSDQGKRGNLQFFSEFLFRTLEKTSEATTERTIQVWLKQQAWEEMMLRARQRWKDLAPYAQEMNAIPPDNTEQLTTFIQSKGSIIAQAGLAMLRPFVGQDVFGGPTAAEVEQFIKEYYGPSIHAIADKVTKLSEESGYSKDLSVEEVQRIKDLVAKVGRLEFRILANSHDDKAAIDDAMQMINKDSANPELAKELADAQAKGLPPPGPREPDGTPKRYTITLARGYKSTVTYSWVELGQLERKSLNLDNAAKNDPQRNRAWVAAYSNRGKALKLPEPTLNAAGQQQYLLQGALFYSRKCEDRNLPEEERRQKEVEYFVLARDPEFDPSNPNIRTPDIDGSLLVSAYADRDNVGRPIVGFTFGPVGADLFGTLTRKNVTEGSGPESTKKMRHLAIILDGLVMSAPTINSEIRDRGSISGSFTQKQVDELVNILRAGRLPQTLKPQPVSESTMGPTLGQDTINRGVFAIGIAFAVILAFMVVYYRFAGLVASVALLANLLLTVGFMVFVQATFTLPGLAGLVLMLGMAVDANILIYERLREERERGASLALAIRNGYDRALPTIIDTHLSSIFTAVVLYVVGNDQLKGFGVSLTVGLIISLFTSLYMTRVMFDYALSRGWLHKLTMLRLFARPDFDFMGIRYLMFGLTAAASILGVALFIGRLPNDLNIDFVGGTAYGGKLTKAVTVTTMRDLLDEKHQKEVFGDPKGPADKGVQVTEDPNGGGRRYTLTYPSGAARTVSLANPPTDSTPEERASAVRLRAMQLPDPSVELIYHTFAPVSEEEEAPAQDESGGSKEFVVRTSEKEVDLVQAALDQLLRDESGKPLLKKVILEAEPLKDRVANLTFKDDVTGRKAGGSPSFVKTLLTREVRKQFGLKERDNLPFIIEVTGEGQSLPDESYYIVKVAFGEALKDEADIAKVQAALVETQRAFAERPQPDRLENFDSQLATDTRYRAMWAILASWGAILVYLWFRFGNWTFGLAAVLCLVHDLCFTLGAIAVAHYLHYIPYIGDWLMIEDFKIDLPAVAALLTLAGYSTNDTIVVFDRIKEVRGKNPDLTPKMLNDSVNQTLSRTVLASLATWLVVFVLYVAGGPGVHLFAYVMVIGVLVGTYSSIYIASPLLLLFGEGRHEESRAGERAPVPQPESVNP